tara:strand:+ start:1824 stop:2096 length:273 start_codon:yes stop_codon:yes gene_type:complete
MKKVFFTVGPFAEIEERIDDFGSSMYLQKLYNETVQELVETELAYETAKNHNDADDIIKGLRSQIKFLENVVTLANNNMSSFMSDKIYYD